MNTTSADTCLVTQGIELTATFSGKAKTTAMASRKKTVPCIAEGLGHIDFVILALELHRTAVTHAISVLFENAADQRADEACALERLPLK